MELGQSHIMVPLQDWNTIKKHVDILAKKGCEVIEISKKGCEVHEISNVVKCMMEAIDHEQPDFGINEPDCQEFEEPGGVVDPVSETTPTWYHLHVHTCAFGGLARFGMQLQVQPT